MSIGERPQVGSGLQFIASRTASSQASHIDFGVEVADVAHNCVVLHLEHVLNRDDVIVASCRNEDVNFTNDVFESGDLVTLHGCLQSINRVGFCHDDSSTLTAQRLYATLTHIAVTTYNGNFAGDHDVSCTTDCVNQRVTASVQVVKLRLGH